MTRRLHHIDDRSVRIRLDDESGFSMLEVMMAITIFAFTAAAVAALLGASLRVSGGSRGRAVAANLAAQEMDVVRSTAFTDLPLGSVSSTQQVDGIAYTIRRETEWVNEDASSGPCEAPPGSTLSFLAVNVSVRWPGMGGVAPPRSQTIVSPPVGTYDESSGHIAVSIVDRDGGPQQDVTVVASGPSGSSSQVTTSDGCAFFPYQDAGSYTVSISAVGSVDTVNAATASQTVTVSDGTTSTAQFQFDEATTIDVTLQGVNGATPAGTVPVTIANAHIVPTGTAVYPGSGSTRSLPGLFPWADGYSVFAGGCADADPLGESAPGVPYWDGSTRPDPIEAVPGGSSTATVVMPEIEVTAVRDVGSGPQPAVGAQVQAVHAADDGCPSGVTYDLGTTDGSGSLGAALPFGTWAVYVDGSLADTAVLDPRDPWSVYPRAVGIDLT